MKIGLLFGCFNPIHNGHVALANKVLNANLVDKVWFVPAFTNLNYKDTITIDGKLRYEMIKLAIANQVNMDVCDIEIKQKDQIFTYETLRMLSSSYNHTFYPILATDNLKTLDKWVRNREIMSNYKIIVAKRNQENIENIIENSDQLRRFKTSFIIMDGEPENDLSSTLIRNNINDKELIINSLDSKVHEFILKNLLYLGEEKNEGI